MQTPTSDDNTHENKYQFLSNYIPFCSRMWSQMLRFFWKEDSCMKQMVSKGDQFGHGSSFMSPLKETRILQI